MDFGKLVTAMVTPFDETLSVNWSGLNSLIDYLVDTQRSDSLVVCGTTGESPTLSDEEKFGLFEAAVQRTRGRAKVIAGTGSNNTQHSIEMSKRAEEIGVDALLLVIPYYNKPSQNGLYEHFRAIAESVQIPIMLYNIPSRSSVNLTADTVIRLSHIDNIVAVKESSGDLIQITEIVGGTSDDFTVYSGDDSLTLPVLSIGGAGIVSVASHLVGAEMKQMMEAYFSGNVREAALWNSRLMPLFRGIFGCSNSPSPAPVKYLLNHLNVEAGGVRLPMTDVNPEDQIFLQKCIQPFRS